MDLLTRRRLLAMTAGAMGMGILSFPVTAERPSKRAKPDTAVPMALRPTFEHSSAHSAAPLLEHATVWIEELRSRGETHVMYPISRLQRAFQSGYLVTCYLAVLLEQRGEWTIGFTSGGLRYAHIHAKALA